MYVDYAVPFLRLILKNMSSFKDRTVRLLGQGTFGKVVEAVDIRSQSRVAVKIIRAIPKYRDASKIEIRVLNRLKERDAHNIQYVSPNIGSAMSLIVPISIANVYIYWNALTTGITFVLLRNSSGSVFMTS